MQALNSLSQIIANFLFQAKFLDFKIQNMVGSCDVKFPIRLEGLVLSHGQFSRYTVTFINNVEIGHHGFSVDRQ